MVSYDDEDEEEDSDIFGESDGEDNDDDTKVFLILLCFSTEISFVNALFVNPVWNHSDMIYLGDIVN